MADAKLDKMLSMLGEMNTRLVSLEKKVASGSTGSGDAAAGGAGDSASDADLPSSVLAYDDIIQNELAAFVAKAEALGPDTAAQAGKLKEVFTTQRDMILIASKAKKPADAEVMELCKGTGEAMQAVEGAQNPRSDFRDHLATVGNAVMAFQWVLISPAPVPFINELAGAGQMYGNKVLMKYRNTDGGQPHVDFVKSFQELIKALEAYVKENHRTGLTWKPNGVSVAEAKGSVSGAAAAAPAAPPAKGPGGPPPPPGPPPPGLLDVKPADANAKDSGAGMGAVFAAINDGNVTGGLKKVTKDMKSKNQAGRTGAVPASASSSAAPKAAAAKPAVVKPPKFELAGKKWVIEHQIDNMSMEIEECDIKQTAYLYKCEGKKSRSVLQLKKKINAVTLDSCSKTSVVVDSVVSSIDIVNSKSIELQVLGKAPTLSLDNVNGCILYLSKDSLDTTIVTSKCSEINVVLPSEDESKDPVEYPVPEQFVTTIQNGELTTVSMNHVGA